jgi:hypothetical protein
MNIKSCSILVQIGLIAKYILGFLKLLVVVVNQKNGISLIDFDKLMWCLTATNHVIDPVNIMGL